MTDKRSGERTRKKSSKPNSDAEFRDFAIKPRIKLFLSADIVGSTAFKQSFRLVKTPSAITRVSVQERKRWQQTIIQFYDFLKDRFPVLWTQKVLDLCGQDKSTNLYKMLAGEPPRFWKTIGDEILFWKEIGHESQLWIILVTWLEAVAEVRPMLRRQGLDVKCCIWLAEFPVRNCALPTKNNDMLASLESVVSGVPDPLGLLETGDLANPAPAISNNDVMLGRYYANPYENSGDVDFIGPGIDVGFRISAFASQRRMSLSIDVAFLLAVSRINLFGTSRNQDSTTPIAYGGKRRRIAKQVLAERDQLKIAIESLKIPDHFALSQGRKVTTKDVNNIFIHYSGTEPLKGVLGGIKYPRFWISIVERNSYEDAKQRMYLGDHLPDESITRGHVREEPVREGPTWGQLYRYCAAFYAERQSYVRSPVILGAHPSDRKACIAWSSTSDPESYALYLQAYHISIGQ